MPAVVQLRLEQIAGLVGHSLDAWALLRSGGDPRTMRTCAFMFHFAARTQALICLIAGLFVYGVVDESWRCCFCARMQIKLSSTRSAAQANRTQCILIFLWLFVNVDGRACG